MKKKILSIALVVALIAIMVSGTLAYFTAEDKTTNTFTIGSVKIEVYENNQSTPDTAIPFGPLTPIVDVAAPADDVSYIDKEVKTKNIGANDAYIRTLIAVPTALLDYVHLDINETGWTKQADTTATVGTVPYTIYTYDHDAAVAAKGFTNVLLKGVYLGADVDLVENADGDLVFALRDASGQITQTSDFVAHDYTGEDYTSNGFDILVASQAIQTLGFDATAQNAATAALNSGFTTHPFQ